jgi:WD40 repeat protein
MERPVASGTPAPPQAEEQGRYDAFLSYAREDGPLAERLVGDLAGMGQHVFFDVYDTPAGADWRRNQARALEASKAFVFLLSPDSLQSEHCRRELEQALANEKLVIPVCHRKVDEHDLPPALANPEWIFLREADRFDEGVEKLVEALHVDHEWREQHTRLATRAREWEDAQHEKSLLLRGADLAEAESWLGSQGGHRQAPTALQTEFIVSSRRAALGRQRRLALVAAAVFLLTAALSVFAFLQRSSALDQKHIAQSRAMAVQARELAQTNLDAGALLALEAYRLQPTLEARVSLLAVVPDLQRAHPVFARDISGRVKLSANPENGDIVLSEGGGTIRWLDPASGKTISRDTVPRWNRYAPVPSPNGKLLAYGASVANLWVWDRDRRKVVARHYDDWTSGTPAYVILFSPDNRTIAVLHATGVLLWDTKSDQTRDLTPPRGRDPYMSRAMALSRNGRFLAAGGADGCVYIWRVVRGSWMTQPRLCGQSWATSLSFSHSGDRLAVGERKGIVRVWELSRPAREKSVARIHRGAVAAVTFDRDDETVASASEDGVLSIWNSSTGQLAEYPIERNSSISSLSDKRAFDDVVFDASGETLVAISEGAGRAWNASPESAFGEQVGDRGIRGSERHDYGDAVSPDGRLVAVRSVDGPPVIWNRRSGKRVSLTDVEGIGPLEFSSDGRTIVAQGHNHAVLWNATSGELERAINYAPAVINSGQSAALSPDGELIVTTKDFPKDEGKDFGVQVWGVSDGGLVKSLPSLFHYETSDVSFSPDGKLLAATGIGELSRGTIRLWDTRSWAPVARRSIDRSQAFSGMAFSPDGEILATARRPGPVQLWSVPGLEPIGKPILADVDVVPALAFSPDGATLATGGEDGRIRLWDTATQELLGRPITAHSRHVDTLRFSSDGRELISVGEEGAVRAWDSILWSSDLAQLQAFICGAVGRDLTPGEWRQVAPEESYRLTCSP